VNKSGLRAEVLALDMAEEVPVMDVPVYFLSGRYDLTGRSHNQPTSMLCH